MSTETMRQELKGMEVGEVRYYRIVCYYDLIKLLKGNYINFLGSPAEEIKKGYITITKQTSMFSIKIFSRERSLIYEDWLNTCGVKIIVEYITELSTPDEIQQEPTPVHYTFTQHYFGITKSSSFTVMSDWLNLDNPDNSLSTFITCTYWKDGKPEEITVWMTKDQLMELIANGVVKEEPQSEDQQTYMKVLKFYWSLSDEGRKEHFKLVFQDPSVSQYRYKMDKDVIITTPSKYAPYSDLVPSEVYDSIVENPFRSFSEDTDKYNYIVEDVVKHDLNLIATLEETNRLLSENNELMKMSMEIVPRYKSGRDYVVWTSCPENL